MASTVQTALAPLDRNMFCRGDLGNSWLREAPESGGFVLQKHLHYVELY